MRQEEQDGEEAAVEIGRGQVVEVVRSGKFELTEQDGLQQGKSVEKVGNGATLYERSMISLLVKLAGTKGAIDERSIEHHGDIATNPAAKL